MKKLILLILILFIANTARGQSTTYQKDQYGNTTQRTVCYKTRCDFFDSWGNYTGKVEIRFNYGQNKQMLIYYDKYGNLLNTSSF